MADTVIWSDLDGGPTPNQGLIVRFKRTSKRNVHKSNELGHPVDEPVDQVTVWQAGEKDNVIFDVNELHKRMWPREWAAFQQGLEQIDSGTPLDTLFPGNPEIVSTLKANHVHTVQQLAALPDTSTAFKFAADYRAKAQKFLDGIENNRFPALEQENAELKAQMAEIQEQLAALKAAKQETRPNGRPS